MLDRMEHNKFLVNQSYRKLQHGVTKESAYHDLVHWRGNVALQIGLGITWTCDVRAILRLTPEV